MSKRLFDPRCAMRSTFALGALTLAAGLLPSAVHAASVCSSSATFDGGTSLDEPEYVGTLCGTSVIKPAMDETIPRFWSFTWGGTDASTMISGLITNDIDNFPKVMHLYYAFILFNETVVNPDYFAYADFSPSSGSSKSADITTSLLTPGFSYVVSIEAPGDPTLQISFSQAGATPTVPLPASLPMLGGALAVLGLAHRLRKARS